MLVVKKTTELTKEDFSWLPVQKTCSCSPERYTCLTGKELAEYGSTVLQIRKRHVWKYRYKSQFIPDLPLKYLKLLSHTGECILDPFSGSGTTNVVAKQLGRHSIGIDINSEAVKIGKIRMEEETSHPETRHVLIQGSVLDVLKAMPRESIDLVVTSPPYYNITDYGQPDEKDQWGRIYDYNLFLKNMKDAFVEIHKVLKSGRYFVLNTMDVFKKRVTAAMSIDYTNICREIGFTLHSSHVYILYFSTGGRLVFGKEAPYFKNDFEHILIFRK